MRIQYRWILSLLALAAWGDVATAQTTLSTAPDSRMVYTVSAVGGAPDTVKVTPSQGYEVKATDSTAVLEGQNQGLLQGPVFPPSDPTCAIWTGRPQGLGGAYTLSGIWTKTPSGSGGNNGGAKRWNSQYDYSDVPRISLSVSPSVIASGGTAVATVSLLGGTDGTSYTPSLADETASSGKTPAGTVTITAANPPPVLTTKNRYATWTVTGGTPGYRDIKATCTGVTNSPQKQEITVVSLSKIQYATEDAPGDPVWHDYTMPLRVLQPREFGAKAISALQSNGLSVWPPERPTWSGTAGVTGVGESKSVKSQTASAHNMDYRTVIVECGNSVTMKLLVCNTVLGVQVRTGNAQPGDSSSSDGHAWLTVARCTATGMTTTTYGLWPDDHDLIVALHLANGDRSDLRVNLEGANIGGVNFVGDTEEGPVHRYYLCTPLERATLDAELYEVHTWNYWHNCASFAVHMWNSIATGSNNLNASSSILGIATPPMLARSILEREGVEQTWPVHPSGCDAP